MKRSFSIAYIMGNRGCYDESKLKATFEKNGRLSDFITKAATISIEDIISSNIPLQDKYWFLCNKSFSLKDNKAIALLALDVFREYFINTYKETTEVSIYFATVKSYLQDKVKWDILSDDFWKAFSSIPSDPGGWVLHGFVDCYVCADPGVVYEKVSYRFLRYTAEVKTIEQKMMSIVMDFIKLL